MSEEVNVDTSVAETSAETPAETLEAPETPETPAPPAEPEVQEELSYHAVQKDGKITAIWEMRGRKHVRTIDPRSDEGRHLLGPHEQDGHPEAAADTGADAAH